MTLQAYNIYDGLTAVRLVATSNQSGTYNNGTLNNGVGATFTYATGALTIDSVSVNVGDRILFQNQTAAEQNGIYECIQAGATGISAILRRSSDFQCIEQLKTGQYVSVAAGTANAGVVWTLIEPKPAALGIDALSFKAASPSGVGTIASQNANAVNITGGTITGITDLAVADGGTGASTGAGALTNFGAKRGTTAAYAGGGTSNAYTATGLASTDIVTATILASTNAVSICKAVPTTNTLTVTFSADPGAGTTVQWHALPA